MDLEPCFKVHNLTLPPAILTFCLLTFVDGEVRLRGSPDNNTGRVEIQVGGVWGTVSDRGWDIKDGHVVCRQLGYLKAVGVYTHSR